MMWALSFLCSFWCVQVFSHFVMDCVDWIGFHEQPSPFFEISRGIRINRKNCLLPFLFFFLKKKNFFS